MENIESRGKIVPECGIKAYGVIEVQPRSFLTWVLDEVTGQPYILAAFQGHIAVHIDRCDAVSNYTII
jgi:hypothetical protein